ncbi:MAG: TlpA disulfide reductase family protein [Sphaerochaetaceae bacterium]|nr:TlpA disulfide reductase family protein [Spirochaetales bacterium]MDY5499016.1 TlpA disulfide reductase family protein [Sphaerochaetaceae bacterium]
MKRVSLLVSLLLLSSCLFAANIRSVFSGTALSGMPVSSSQLARKERTLLFVWATWCGYCRAEMPDLAEVAGKYPTVQVIGICTDLADGRGNVNARQRKVVEQIMETAGLRVLTIAPSSTLSSSLLDSLSGIPAAFWVDANGEVLEGPIYGQQTQEALVRQFEAMQ